MFIRIILDFMLFTLNTRIYFLYVIIHSAGLKDKLKWNEIFEVNSIKITPELRCKTWKYMRVIKFT